jgi:predicted PurR-regulated permease PerM
MLGFDRTAARYASTTALVLLLLILIYQVRATLFLFVLAVLFAYLLSPAVDLLYRAMPGRARTWALAVVYVMFVGLVVVGVSQIGSKVADEAKSLAGKFPGMLDELQRSAIAPGGSLQQTILANIRSGLTQKINELIGALPNAGLKFLSVASNIIYVVIVPILAFFFLKDGAVIRTHFLELVSTDERMRAFADGLIEDIHALLARYMRALVVLSLSTFAAYGTFFTIMGVPYGILLAVLAMMLEFIPMIGPLVAGTVILIVVGVAGGIGAHTASPADAVAHTVGLLPVLIFLLVFRMFQDYVLSPHIMGQGVELHPLLVLFGVLAGAEVAGVAGSFLSVPLLALVRILYIRMRRQRLTR